MIAGGVNKETYSTGLDLESTQVREEIKTWSQSAWEGLISKGLRSRNVILYHSCCSSISKRKFASRANHPEDDSFKLNKVLRQGGVDSAEKFGDWVLKQLATDKRYGRAIRFPSINIKHLEEHHRKKVQEAEQIVFLTKRVNDLEFLLKTEELKRLQVQEDNTRLYSAAKFWSTQASEQEEKVAKYLSIIKVCPTCARKTPILDIKAPFKHQTNNSS